MIQQIPLTDAAYEGGREKLTLSDPAEFAAEGRQTILSTFQRTKRWRKFTRKARVARFLGLSSLTGSMGTTFSWNAQVSLTGIAYAPSVNSSSINKRQSFGTSATNAQSGGCDEVFSFQQGIVAGGSATLDLNGMTDLLQRASTAIARIKGYQFRVLSATDDSTISPAPTSTSVGLVTNNTVATPCQLDFSAGGSGLTLALTDTAGAVTAVAIGAAGSGYLPSATFSVLPVQTGGSGAVINVTTNASGVPTSVAVAAGGAGYTSATVPSVAMGQYTIYTGGAHCYFDPSAAGFTTVSSTQKNVLLKNLAAGAAITFEIDVFGATS
jgi:hypothetical protein